MLLTNFYLMKEKKYEPGLYLQQAGKTFYLVVGTKLCTQNLSVNKLTENTFW